MMEHVPEELRGLERELTTTSEGRHKAVCETKHLKLWESLLVGKITREEGG